MALAQRACSGTALVLCAVLVGPVHAAKVSDAAATHEWMSTPVRTAAEQMLAAMPDDYYSIKGVAAEMAIATGVPHVLDVREPNEFAVEHIPGAKNVPLRSLMTAIDDLPGDKAASLIVYCKTGHRGAIALAVLRMLGYANVLSLYGGLDGWKAAGFVIEK